MQTTDPVDTLNGLMQRVYRSLPMYLAEARPWTPPGREAIVAALENLAADQRVFSERLAAAILDLGGMPNRGRFPTSFTDVHDLDVAYLVKNWLAQHRDDIQAARQCAAALGQWPSLQALAEEIAGNLRGHLEVLEELISA